MSSAAARRAELIEAAWPVATAMVALAHVAVGVAMLVDGASGFTLPVFRTADLLPWWAWSAWAITSGLVMLAPRTRTVGLTATTAWYAVWWALLTVGLIRAGGPHYSIAVYGLLVAGHVLLFVVEVLPALEQRFPAPASRAAMLVTRRTR